MSVKVFSAKWCQGCTSIKHKLAQEGIPHEVIDIDTEDGMEKAKELGIRNIPVTFVDGKKFIGSQPETVRSIVATYREARE